MASLLCCGCGNPKHELVRWPDGTNDCYAIEAESGRGHIVLIPDVRFLQKNDRFITGRGYWRYMEGFNHKVNGKLFTNEFWFVLDKNRRFRKCDAYISMDVNSWMSFCFTKGAPTNIVEVNGFRETAPPYNGGKPEL